MQREILAMAIIKVHDGKEEDFLEVLRDFYSLLQTMNYSRDVLYKANDGRYVNMRYWASEEARDSAHEDPNVHRFWRRLAEICDIEHVYERLDQVK
ncbi:MAG: putative quinol monooxygenase [Burkholderiales bacterium]